MNKYIYGLIIIIILAISSCAYGENFRYESLQRGQHEISLLTGYGENHRIPTAMKDRFGYDSLRLRYGKFISPRSALACEFSAGKQIKGVDNFALSSVFSYRKYFYVKGGVAVGYDFGLGLVHFFDEVEELGTKTNFTEQIGVSFQYATGRSSAFTFDYKFNHISNAGTKRPNIGLNTSLFSVGHTWYK